MLNSKKKGNLWENRWANWLISQGIKAWKDGASGGGTKEKSDVGNNIDACFQVKAVKKINIRQAWNQAEKDAEQPRQTPYVVLHLDGMAEDEFLVILNNYSWLELLQKEKIKTDYQNPNLKYKLQRLIESGKAVLKEIEI